MCDNNNCSYDCYQITLEVNITEEDSCFLSRLGPSIFNIREVSGSKSEGCSCSGNNQSPPGSPHCPEISMPRAVIVNIDVDKCDCTKAVFTLYVRLPCVPYSANMYDSRRLSCKYNDNISPSLANFFGAVTYHNNNNGDDPDINLSTYTANASALDVAFSEFINLLTRPEAPSPCDLKNALCNLKNALSTLEGTISGIINNSPGNGDSNIVNTGNAAITALVEFSNCLNRTASYQSVKYSIYSTAGYRERSLVTFLVNPLKPRDVSTGVVDKCYKYEISRVAERKFEQHCGRVTCGNNTYNIASDCDTCCPPAAESHPVLRPNVLHLTFPLTKELKCLLPDFNLPGTYLNTVMGTLPTVVKIVASCPQPFSFPARMTFDKTNCTVCLEILYDCELFAQLSHGYEHEFARCDSLSPIQQALKNAANADEFFHFLSFVRKFDVVGVHKCNEKVFFTFQICEVPYRSFCVDICGCKAKTVLPCHAADVNTFVVVSDSEFTYEFSRKCEVA